MLKDTGQGVPVPRLKESPTSDYQLRLAKKRDGSAEVYLKLSKDHLERAGAAGAYPVGHEVHVLTVDEKRDRLTMYPRMLIHTSRKSFLDQRYDKLEEIVLEGFGASDFSDPDVILDALSGLPAGFVKDLDISLGLAYDYRFVAKAVEELTDARRLTVSRTAATVFNEKTRELTLSYRDFEVARKAINRITTRAQDAAADVKEASVHNQLAKIVGGTGKTLRVRRNKMTRRFQEALSVDGYLDDADQDSLVRTVAVSARSIAKVHPEKIEMMRDELQLVTLEMLISKFEGMLSKQLPEAAWQTFFVENPFILSFAFGYPVVKVEGHASVGGKKISGDGEKIADFLYKHHLTGNTALFEIKTPATALLEKREYRDGIYGPSKEFSGAVSQVLDQRYQFQTHFASKVLASKRYDLASYAVGCCVIIGRLPIDAHEQKSFELARTNSKDVEVVTFDELLDKLKQLCAFLSKGKEAESKVGVAFDVTESEGLSV